MSQPGSGQAVYVIPPLTAKKRLAVRLASLAAGVLAVVFLNLVPLRFETLDISHIAADWITTTQADGAVVSQKNWFSVQAFEWLAFFLGLGELWLLRRGIRSEAWLLKVGLLPEDDRTMLTSEKLAPIYVRARSTAPDAALPTLLRRLVKEFRKSHSVERVNAVLDSSLELLQHRADLRYTLLRYLVWVIPALGFFGTAVGIANALVFVGSGDLPTEELLLPTTQKLGVAFHTTMLALLQSGLLMLGLNLTQAEEERVLNETGQYCLDNLVIRLTEPSQIGQNA